MPEGAGLLLDQTWRMHPDLCRFTSEAFYDGKLHGVDGLDRQSILGLGAGLRIVEVAHQGNTNASAEEAREVARLTAQLTGCTWRDAHGASRVVGVDDILIVTPYNAQIRAIQGALAASGQSGFGVGTVDKFQGREAPVVIYSMATSSADLAPRGLEFLYDRHRLNVATSRARALAIIVASPDLIRVSCRTPPQMVLANALCQAGPAGRAWEASR
jgi:AAA domain